MTAVLGAVVLLVLAVAVVIALAALKARQKVPFSGTYVAKKPLSEPEQVLYWRLREAMPECVVLSQVSFGRFLEPKAAHRGARQALFNRISRKAVDFLVCLPDFTLVAAVELDDGSHRGGPDAARDEILRSAGIPIVRFNVREIPSVERLRAAFTK